MLQTLPFSIQMKTSNNQDIQLSALTSIVMHQTKKIQVLGYKQFHCQSKNIKYITLPKGISKLDSIQNFLCRRPMLTKFLTKGVSCTNDLIFFSLPLYSRFKQADTKSRHYNNCKITIFESHKMSNLYLSPSRVLGVT